MKWLEEKGIEFEARHIMKEPLTADEIREIHVRSEVAIECFFNVNGKMYRELGLKEKLKGMSDEACYELLATDGKLVKRPLVYDDSGKITFGFKMDVYGKMWL